MTRLTNATYVKIALVVLLCLVLCGGIFSCSVGCTAAARHASEHFWNTYSEHDLTESGDASVRAEAVRNIELEWLAGRVDFKVVPDADSAAPAAGVISLVEEGSESMPEQRRMRWQLEGDTLEIGYGWQDWGMFGCSAAPGKNLTISIPESAAAALRQVEISAASGEYSLGAIGCESLDVELASGRMTGEGLRADRLSLDVASGNVALRGDFPQMLTVDLASGDVDVECAKTCPKSAKISLASGNVVLGLPEQSGFTAALNRMSGGFNCAFPQEEVKQNGDGGCTVGDGASMFTVDMMSGNVTVRPI